MRGLVALLRREAALAGGRGGSTVLSAAFYVGLCALFPLAAGPDPGRLARLAPAIAFAALALSSLLPLERLFERDLEDGGLDLLALGPLPLEAVCAAKCLAQLLAAGAPLALLAPAAALALGCPAAALPMVLASALLAATGFVFTGGIGAALACGSRRGGLLLAVVVLPLYAPPLIFGAGAVHAAIEGASPAGALAYLAAYVLAALALAPLAMAAALRNAIS